MAKPKTENPMIPVLVTTEFRGVFFGRVESTELPTDKTLVVHNCRCAIYWSGRSGFLGLAAHGPEDGSTIGAAAPKVLLHGVTSVSECTPEAVSRWESYAVAHA